MRNGSSGIKTLIVQECYQEIPIGENDINALTMKEADELARYIDRSNLKKSNFMWGRHGLRIVNYVGYIRLSTVGIEVLPKTGLATGEHSRKVLLDLLYHSGYCNVAYSAISELKDIKHNLFEIFGYLFAENLKRELLKGAVAAYVSTENNLPVLKGKLLINKHLTNVIRGTAKAYCQYDEFSIDNLLNRILKMAAAYLLHKVRNEKTLTLLKFCLLHFDEVDENQVMLSDFDKVKFDRTNNRFFVSFTLAKLLLLGRSSVSSVGSNQNFALLFSMNELFERYISVQTRRHIDYNVHLQHARYKLLVNEKTNYGVYTLKPDIVISDDEQEFLIIDTKWKAVSDKYFRHGVSREDYFQMYAYLTRYKAVETVILLYPHNSNVSSGPAQCLESYYLDGQPEKKLKVYTVDYEDVGRTIDNLKAIVNENIR